VFNAEVYAALTRNVGKVRELKKVRETMATEIATLNIENSELRRKHFIRICFMESL
jgi:regulator of replication initiation timing